MAKMGVFELKVAQVVVHIKVMSNNYIHYSP